MASESWLLFSPSQGSRRAESQQALGAAAARYSRSCNAIFTKLDLNTVKFINLEVRGKTVFRARHMSVLAQDPSVGAGRAPAAELQGHGEEVRSCFHSEALGAGTSGNAG